MQSYLLQKQLASDNEIAIRSGRTPLSTEWQNARRILAIRLDNIGDVVMLSPALRAIHDTIPTARVTLMASPAGSQVAPLLPWVDELITWRASWQDISGSLIPEPERENELVELLRSRHFDAAIIFTSFSQSPYPPAFICYMAGIPLRLGQSKEFGGSLLTQWVRPTVDNGHQVERNLHLLREAGFQIPSHKIELNISEDQQQKVDDRLKSMGIQPGDFILLAPGASAAARRYEMTRFAEAARMVARRTHMPLLVVGSPSEAAVIEPVTRLSCEEHNIQSITGETSLQELAGIIRRANLVIANNSASIHVADAFERPMVILYSGTEYITQWQPRFSPTNLLRRETACSPCFKFQCPYQMECLDIPPEEVAQAVLNMLDYTRELQKSDSSHLVDVAPDRVNIQNITSTVS